MTEERLRGLLQPFVSGAYAAPLALSDGVYEQLSAYLDLLLRWNARTNLTGIREPEEIVTRHFGEGLFTAAVLQEHIGAQATLLDLGSGAGIPGLPVQLALPGLVVTLAESQGKKAAFLRETIRVLGLSTSVWAARAETLPLSTRFEVVALRAVDRIGNAMQVGVSRITTGGLLADLSMENSPTPATLMPFRPPVRIPNSKGRMLRLWRSAS